MKDLREAVVDLNSSFADMQAKIETLDDIEVRLGWLKDKMNDVDFSSKGFMTLAIKEYHQTLRILWGLMNYTMRELHEYCAKVDERQDYLFDEIVRSTRKEGK